MSLTFETKAKTTGVLVSLEAEIAQAIEYITKKKKCTRDDFIKESIYRNINYFMQVEDKDEKPPEFVEPEIIRAEEPKPKAPIKKKKRSKTKK